MPDSRAHYVIEYHPDRTDCWLVVDRNHEVIVDYYDRSDFDGAIMRMRELRGDVAVGDLS